ncbi:MAG TPA: DoxX family protein [Polyangiaceae bacterium]|nr:DoxX family protein [Polyangiaceae bacterium]
MDQVHPLPGLTVAPISQKLVWTGRVLTGLVVAFLLFDGAVKLIPIEPVIEAMRRLGYPVEIARPLGVVLLSCTALHAVARTQFLGALLLTAYLGGATATHVRIGDPFWFPIVMGVMLWAGLYLREPRLRALLGAPGAA